jgi:hypothetical protein
MKLIPALLVVISISGCTANKLIPGANSVSIDTGKPENCRYLGLVAGSQGNWFTDDITSTENKIVGSENEMKNQAFKIGANVVHLISVDMHKSAMSLGTTNATQVGHAYICN